MAIIAVVLAILGTSLVACAIADDREPSSFRDGLVFWIGWMSVAAGLVVAVIRELPPLAHSTTPATPAAQEQPRG